MSSYAHSTVMSTIYSADPQSPQSRSPQSAFLKEPISPPFNPYTLDHEHELQEINAPANKRYHVESSPRPLERRKPRGLGFYRSISWMLGFHDKYSLINCFVWGGALVGFCLARSITMNPSKIAGLLVPGEWFWFSRPLYKINLFIHIYLTTFGGILALLQFFPAIRRRKVILHRLNGYGVLFCLVVGNICGAIVARRSFGGELNVQSAYYILAIMIVYSAVLGVYTVKRDTKKHRKWMLRMVTYFAVVITARLIMLAGRSIVSIIGTYYSVWQCDEVLNLLTDPSARAREFPQCVADGVDPSAVFVAVHASMNDGKLHVAAAVRSVQGMALWIATIIHMAAVEFYIIKTESSNQVRLGFALGPHDDSENTPTAY